MLKQIHDEFVGAKAACLDGRNRKIRDKGSKDSDVLRMRFKHYTDSNPELIDYLLSNPNHGSPGVYAWSEYCSFKYFDRDLDRSLRCIEEELEN